MRVVEKEWVRERVVYGVSFTRWPSSFIANLLNETCRAYIVRLLVPSVAQSPPIRVDSKRVYRLRRLLNDEIIYVLPPPAVNLER